MHRGDAEGAEGEGALEGWKVGTLEGWNGDGGIEGLGEEGVSVLQFSLAGSSAGAGSASSTVRSAATMAAGRDASSSGD